MQDGERAKLIVTLRKARGLTQAELAALIGVTPNAVSRWERGVANIQRGHRVKLARKLGVKVEDLGFPGRSPLP